MSLVSKENLISFQQNGFLVIDNNLSDELLNKARTAFLEIKKKSEHSYKYVRVYDDYSNKINLAGIELPFHSEIINQDIINLIEEKKIIKIAKNILQDKNIQLTLCRYHLTSKYSHIGIWHRDGRPSVLETIQLNIYLYDENGTEIIPGSHLRDDNEEEKLILSKSKYSLLNGAKKITCKSGQVLVFHPSLLHRGISDKDRAHIHFRFSKKKEVNKFYSQDYNYLQNYKISDEVKDSIFKSSINLEDIELYSHKKDIKSKILRKIRFLIHKILFFLPYHSKIYGKLNVRPCLKNRKKFKIS